MSRTWSPRRRRRASATATNAAVIAAVRVPPPSIRVMTRLLAQGRGRQGRPYGSTRGTGFQPVGAILTGQMPVPHDPGSRRVLAQEPDQERHLEMEPVGGLEDDLAVRSVEHA